MDLGEVIGYLGRGEERNAVQGTEGRREVGKDLSFSFAFIASSSFLVDLKRRIERRK